MSCLRLGERIVREMLTVGSEVPFSFSAQPTFPSPEPLQWTSQNADSCSKRENFATKKKAEKGRPGSPV